jgi:hypothetical protein
VDFIISAIGVPLMEGIKELVGKGISKMAVRRKFSRKRVIMFEQLGFFNYC